MNLVSCFITLLLYFTLSGAPKSTARYDNYLNRWIMKCVKKEKIKSGKTVIAIKQMASHVRIVYLISYRMAQKLQV